MNVAGRELSKSAVRIATDHRADMLHSTVCSQLRLRFDLAGSTYKEMPYLYCCVTFLLSSPSAVAMHISCTTFGLRITAAEGTRDNAGSDDGKCKVPVGEPELPVNTGVKPSSAPPTHINTVAEASSAADHDFHRSNVVPNGHLVQQVPE